MVLIVALGCGDPNDSDTDIEATEPIAAGDAYEAWLASLGDCVPRAGDGRLDLRSGCADGVCVGDPFARFTEAFGEPTCHHGMYGLAACEFSTGVSSWFDDPEGELHIEAEAHSKLLWVTARFTGTTMDGLGIGSSLSCLVETLGTPAQITIDPEPYVTGDSVTWYDPYIAAQDGASDVAPDSRIDALYLGG